MKAVDTNLLVRLLVADDPDQARKVRQLLRRAEREEAVYHVPLVVVLELLWVLDAVYDRGREEILDALNRLASLPVLQFEDADVVAHLVVRGRKEKTDLDDLLIGLSARNHGCENTLTLDARAARSDLFQRL